MYLCALAITVILSFIHDIYASFAWPKYFHSEVSVAWTALLLSEVLRSFQIHVFLIINRLCKPTFFILRTCMNMHAIQHHVTLNGSSLNKCSPSSPSPDMWNMQAWCISVAYIHHGTCLPPARSLHKPLLLVPDMRSLITAILLITVWYSDAFMPFISFCPGSYFCFGPHFLCHSAVGLSLKSE